MPASTPSISVSPIRIAPRAPPVIRVSQVGNVAGVADLIEAALDGHAEVRSVPFRQLAGRRSGLIKLAASPLRLATAGLTALDVRRTHPDVVHVHWVPNAPIGMLTGLPWLLEAHGSDIRRLNVLRRRLYHAMIRSASAFVVATPDLLEIARAVRSDARYIPNPVIPRTVGAGQAWDIGLASAAEPVKAPEIAFRALGLMGHSYRAWASDGSLYDQGSHAVRQPRSSHQTFVERLAGTKVVLGQFGLGAIGNVELEAMSVGRPVIAYVEARWYPDPPPIISERDPDRIAGYVRRLLADEAYADEIGQAGRAWVARHHSPATIRDALLELYDEIKHERRNHGRGGRGTTLTMPSRPSTKSSSDGAAAGAEPDRR